MNIFSTLFPSEVYLDESPPAFERGKSNFLWPTKITDYRKEVYPEITPSLKSTFLFCDFAVGAGSFDKNC